MWKALPAGTTMLSTGASAHTAISATKKAVQPLARSRGPFLGSTVVVMRTAPCNHQPRRETPRNRLCRAAGVAPSRGCRATRSGQGWGWSYLRAPAFDGEDALRPLLDEDDDEHEHRDLREHGAGPAFDELVEDAEPERRVDGASELPDPAHHDHHEGVDDVALPQVRADIADLRERAARQARDAGTEREGIGVDAAGVHAHARGDRPVRRDAAHEQAEARAADQPAHREQHQRREHDDADAVPRQGDVAETR